MLAREGRGGLRRRGTCLLLSRAAAVGRQRRRERGGPAGACRVSRCGRGLARAPGVLPLRGGLLRRVALLAARLSGRLMLVLLLPRVLLLLPGVLLPYSWYCPPYSWY